MSVQISGPGGTPLAGVNADNTLSVKPTTVSQNAGMVALTSRVDAGAVIGTPKMNDLEATEDFRLRTAEDGFQLTEMFPGTTINRSTWSEAVTTMTVTVATRMLTLNAGSSVASGAVARVQSYGYFPVGGSYALTVEIQAVYSASAFGVLNNVWECGPNIAAGTAAPLDGALFRVTASGELRGISSYAGAETQTEVMPALVPGQSYTFVTVISRESVQFFVNNVLYGNLPRTTSAGAPVASTCLPVTVRTYNTAATATAVQMRVTRVQVTSEAMASQRPWAYSLAGAQLGGYQAPTGATSGSTANYTNSAAPASATLSNTAAGYATLGGQFQFVAVAGAETDYALFAYQVPAPAAGGSNRRLVVSSVIIDTFNTVVAVATTATVMQWAIGVDSTAVTLLTADGAGTKATRRLALGIQTFPVAAAVGAKAERLVVTFEEKLAVSPGNYVHIILKMPIATATATEIFRGIVTINTAFE